MKFIKYFLVASLSIAFTLFAVNLYVPVLIDVPKKDSLLVDFDFAKEITYKKLIPVDRKAKNIILLIGDGMGSNQIVAYKIAKEGPNGITVFDMFPVSGLVKTHSYNTVVTDSASSATAFSSGIKTINRYLGVDHKKNPVTNITELLHKKAYVNGIIATSEITHATPAAFAAHTESRYNTDAIAEQIFYSNNYFVLGGGSDYFRTKENGGLREDGQDYLSKIKTDAILLETKKDLINHKFKKGKKIFGLFNKEALIREAHEPSLKDMLDFALVNSKLMLEQGCKGFFIMAEGSQIDWEGHDNDFKGLYVEIEEFENAVTSALAFAMNRQDTLVIVTADHETGGLLIEKDTLRYKETNQMKVSWNTAVGKGDHTGSMVPIFAYGPGSENFTGILDNTDIFFAMQEAIGINDLPDGSCY